MNTRLAVYFLCTFLASLGAGVSDELTAAGWVRLVTLSLAAGFASVRAFVDSAGGTPPSVPGIPSEPAPLASFDTAGRVVKILLALATLAGFLALSACRLPTLPPVKAKVCYTTKEGRICAGNEGKAIVLEADGGNFDRENKR
jgi:hypothetical protein